MFFTSNQSIEIQDFSTALNVKYTAFKDSIKDKHMHYLKENFGLLPCQFHYLSEVIV